MYLAVLILVAIFVTLEEAVRRTGGYEETRGAWPARWRAMPPTRIGLAPYREAAGGRWRLVVGAGIPRATSVFLAPVLVMVLLWTLGTSLALGDLGDVAQGKRTLALVLASLLFGAIRALAGTATLLAALGFRRGLFVLSSGVAVGLDAALATLPLPCSDIRADDVQMALAGGTAQAALALSFAFSLLQQRGLVPSPHPSQPPGFE